MDRINDENELPSPARTSVDAPSSETPIPAGGGTPSVSVVVIGRNEGQRLARCLASLLEADYPREHIELIYADTNSTDDSCGLAERIEARVLRLKPERPCAAVARNAGWRAATHELIHFLDGDTLLNRAWLKKAVYAMHDPSVACVFGRREEMNPTGSIYNFWAHHDWYVAPGPAESCAGDALFRRSVLEAAGGFDETLIAGEEPDLCYRIRSEQARVILALAEPMTQHDMQMTRFAQYWRRCVRTGHAYAQIGGRYPGMSRWRRARWRNLAYALGTPTAVLASAATFSLWPIAGWTGLLILAWVRNAARLRSRVGSWPAALKYSFHHYLCKTPAAIGQISYWVRTMFRRAPRPLIEYRQQASV